MKDDSYYMNIAYKEAMKAYKKSEIPVGAVIVSNYDGKIISKAHNLRDESCIVTKHAEIIAIEKANKIKKNWRLNDCILYTTLKPCDMCMSVIKSSKIPVVIYAAESKNNIINSNCSLFQINENIIIEESSLLIQKAFSEIREKNIK